MNRPVNEIVLCNTSSWWIVCRSRMWGPFGYQWSTDLCGIELTFQGEKFGEICSREEFFVDLAPFRIPISVSRIAAIVGGSLAVSLSLVEAPGDRESRLSHALLEFGFGRFVIRNSERLSEESQHHFPDI